MSDVLSVEALEDLERKRQAATPGPWRTMDGYRIGTDLPAINGLSAFVTLAEVGPPSPSDQMFPDLRPEENAAYIASANPEAVGKLLSEVRAWRRLNEELKAQGIHLKNTPGEKA